MSKEKSGSGKERADGAPFVCMERVRWADVDLVGIMRYSAFTRLVEFAEQEMLRAAGLPFAEVFNAPGVWLPRRALTIEYFAPARIDDAIEISSYVSRMGDTSLTFTFDMRLEGGLHVATATMTVVAVSAPSFTKRSLPDHLRASLSRFVVAAPAATEG